MPTPPPLGVGRSCALRASGVSMTRAAIIMRTVAADSSISKRGEAKVAEEGGKGHSAIRSVTGGSSIASRPSRPYRVLHGRCRGR